MSKIILIFFIGCLLPSMIFGQGIRSAARAGQFYPANKIELKELIDEFLTNANPVRIEGNVHAIWVPHAGYLFSGQIAANSYRALMGREYDVVLLIGPSHYVGILGSSVGLYDYFETPLGKTKVDFEFANALIKKSSYIHNMPDAHDYEHSLEVQLPFIQTVFPNTPIVRW